METKEEKAARVNAAIQMLTPPDNPSPMPGQIEAAKVHIGAAMESLSLAKKTAMLEGMVNVIMPSQKIKAEMTAEQFKILGAVWRSARELGKVLGLKTNTIYLYQYPGKHDRKIPEKTARRLIEARMKYNIEHGIAEDPILDSVLQAMGAK